MPDQTASLIVQLGVGGIVAYVLWRILEWFVSGKVHANSEVQGLRQDKAELRADNQRLLAAVEATNTQVAQVLTLLEEIAKRVSPGAQ